MKRLFTATCLLVLLATSVASGQPVPVQVTTFPDTLHASSGMAMGPDGNLYVADWVTDTSPFKVGMCSACLNPCYGANDNDGR